MNKSDSYCSLSASSALQLFSIHFSIKGWSSLISSGGSCWKRWHRHCGETDISWSCHQLPEQGTTFSVCQCNFGTPASSTGFFIMLLHILLCASCVERNVMCSSENVDHLAVIVQHVVESVQKCLLCHMYLCSGWYVLVIYMPSGAV